MPEVRVIDEQGGQLGIMKTDDAIALAQERELDLVEVSPQAQPPVVKLINFDKFRYHQKKLQQQQKKKLKKVELKNIRLSLRIGAHDMETKAKQTQKFIEEGHKAKVDLMMRGREQAFAADAFKIIDKFLALLNSYEVEVPAKKMGNTISTVIKKKSE